MLSSAKHQHIRIIEIENVDCRSIRRPFSTQPSPNHSVTESAGILLFNKPYRDTRALPTKPWGSSNATVAHPESERNSIHFRIEMHSVNASIPIQQLQCVPSSRVSLAYTIENDAAPYGFVAKAKESSRSN